MIVDRKGRQMWRFTAVVPGADDYVRITVQQREAYRSDHDAFTTPLVVTINGVTLASDEFEPFGINMLIGIRDNRTTEEISFDNCMHALWAVHFVAQRIGFEALAKWAEERRERMYAVLKAFERAFPLPVRDEWEEFKYADN